MKREDVQYAFKMAVIVRETREIAGEEREVKVYRTDGVLTKEDKEEAKELDEIIHSKMEELLNELDESGLIEEVGGTDTLELWYTVGKHLKFVDELELLSDQDRDYIWRALYDHAGPLHQNDEIPERVKRSPRTSHFYYCYQLAKFDWDTVKAGGTWTTWVEIFDSKPIRQDERIIDWLVDVIDQHEGAIQDWSRSLNREIRHEFKNKDTSVWEEDELRSRLDRVFERVHGKMSE